MAEKINAGTYSPHTINGHLNVRVILRRRRAALAPEPQSLRLRAPATTIKCFGSTGVRRVLTASMLFRQARILVVDDPEHTLAVALDEALARHQVQTATITSARQAPEP
jgi:hypothetical protein